VAGQFRTTGLRTRFFDRLVAAGVNPQDIIVEPGKV